MSAFVKDIIDTVRPDHGPRRPRRPGAAQRLGRSAQEASIEPQSKLAAVVREAVSKLAGCFDTMKACHEVLMQGVQEYLGFDVAEVDESAMLLVESCAAAFESLSGLLRAERLREVQGAADRVLQECEACKRQIRERAEAEVELQHYEEKLAGLHQAEGASDKIVRNQEKHLRAEEKASEATVECLSSLQKFDDRRVVHTRATIHALLGEYMRLLTACGGAASPAAALFDNELRPGAPVQVAGLQNAPDLNGQGAVVSTQAQEAGAGAGAAGRVTIDLSGVQKSLRRENLIPMDLSPPSAAAAAAAPAPAPADAAAEEEEEEEAATLGPEPEGRSTRGGGGQPREGDASAPELLLSPTQGPVEGCEVELRAAAGRLAGPVEEVRIGGTLAEILEASPEGVRIRVPPAPPGRPVEAEVRLKGWQRYLARAPAAFQYFEALGFGACGSKIDLSAEEGSGLPSAVARRREGLVQGVAVTSTPLAALPPPAPPGTGGATAVKQSYYFEIEVLQLAEKRTNRTLAIGFAWPVQAPATAQLSRPNAWTNSSILPENASALPLGFVVGGDLPKAHFCGRELGKISGWRPVLDVAAVGITLGALLEVEEERLRLAVFQDGTRRVAVEAALAGCGGGGTPPGAPPHGVVDVCGTLQAVRLRQGAVPPAPPPAEPEQQQEEAAG